MRNLVKSAEQIMLRQSAARGTLFLAAVLAMGVARADEPLTVELKTDVEYGQVGDEKLLLDLASPPKGDKPRPALIFIHGGGWAGGRKEDSTEFAKAFAAEGYVAVSVGYRLAPKHHCPAQIEDCKCAVRWMRAHAEELGVDPERIGAIGASAGGHLAMMLGTMDKGDGLDESGGWTDQSSKVQAVVNYVGPTDLMGTLPPVSQGILKNWLGGTREEKKELAVQASPVTYVNAGDAPSLSFMGTKDPLVPHEQGIIWANKLTEAGVPGRVELILGAGHGFNPEEMQRTIGVAKEFLAEELELEKK
jgi:acetyl esterase/lipase